MGSRDSIRQALSLAHAGDRRGAIAALRAAVAVGSSCAELHFQLGLQLAADDRYEEAEAQFREAVRLDRGHADALWNLAMCVGLHGRTDQALGYLEQAHRLRPNDARIGLLYTQATAAPGHGGLISRAESAVPQLDPPHVATLSAQIGGDPELVDAFLVGEPDAEASAALTTLAAALREALRVRDDPRLHFQLGRVLARAGGLEEAIPSLERAISLRPGFVQALIPEISTLGEASLVFIAGEYSHAVTKRPKSGEILCQADHGGSTGTAIAPDWAISEARRVLTMVPGEPLYARVDAVILDHAFQLMEVELIEPELFFTYAPDGADRLATALLDRL